MTTGPSRFELPSLPAATDGWGPSGPPASLEGGVPYAPFSKGERIGRIADFTPSAFKHGRYDRRDREPSISVFNLAANEEDDAFHLVDNKPAQRSRGGNSAPGGGGGGGRGGGGGGRGGGRGGMAQGAAGARARHERERGEPPSGLAGGATAQRAKGNRWNANARSGGGGGFGGNAGGGASLTQSVVIRPDWNVLEQFQCSALAKLSHPQPSVEKGTVTDLAFCGSLEHYDRTYDRLTPRTERPLRPTRRPFVASATASDDAKLKAFAAAAESGSSSSNVKGTALITDSLLAVLMTAPRAVRGWDLVFTKKGNTLFVDKRRGSRADAPTVAESFVDAPPGDDPSLGPDSAASLSDEAAAAQRDLSQQVLLLDASVAAGGAAGAGGAVAAATTAAPPPKHECGDPPIEAATSEASTSGGSQQQPRAGTAYRYRKFTLGGGASTYDVIVRCDVDAVLVDRGETKLVAVRALTEYDPKLTGVDWRAKLEAQRGAVLATELKNNAPKLARWAASALVSGVDLVKLGFVSRSHPRDASAHSVLGAHTFRTRELAANIALSPEGCWGIAHAVIDLAMRLADGKYLLVRESGRPVVRLYGVPVDAFDDEEEDDDEEEGA